MKQRHYILILVVLLAFSCRKKEYPESFTENDPVFYFKATVNNKPVDFSAGIDGYQMYSSFVQDSSFVYSLMGNIRKNDCPAKDCPSSIEIRINDNKVSPANAPVNIEGALHTGTFSYGSPQQTFMLLSSFNKNAASYFWDFGDGTTGTADDQYHTYSKPGRYNVCLTVKDNNNCESTICNEISTGFSDRSLLASVSAVADTGNTVKFTGTTFGGLAPYRFHWNFGDGDTTIGQSPAHAYRYPGSYPVTLKVTDSKNDVTTVRYNAVTKSDQSSCAANIAIGNIFTSGGYTPLSKVTVKWVDEAGVVYQSNSALQHSSNYFQVISVTGYDVNENGEKTKKVHVKFKCDVFNGTSKVTIDNAEAVITVAYK